MRIPPCTHRPPCPGCPRYGESGIAASRIAILEQLAAETGAQLGPAVTGPSLAFRVRARLAVRGRTASPKVGIFQEGSHNIADIPSCTIHHPRINEVARAVRQAIRSSGVAPYADKPHVGLLRYVQLVVERESTRVQVTLVANDATEKSALPMADTLAQLLGPRLHSLWWNGNTERSNAIFGSQWKLLVGDEAIRERIGGADVWFPPGAFGQSNLDLADRLVTDLHERVADDAVVAELYCGVGSIGLGLVPRVREMRFNEVSPYGLQGLAMGVASLPAEQREKTSTVAGEAGAIASIVRGATTVIVDPPRKGLDEGVLQALGEQVPDQVLYVSCDADSLVRDSHRLLESKALRLARLTPYAMFPFTEHVETLAEFVRA